MFGSKTLLIISPLTSLNLKMFCPGIGQLKGNVCELMSGNFAIAQTHIGCGTMRVYWVSLKFIPMSFKIRSTKNTPTYFYKLLAMAVVTFPGETII